MSAPMQTTTKGVGQYIMLRAYDQDFATDIMMVREIRGWSNTTAMPDTVDYVRGVVNLRGQVLPVIDLRARMGGGLTDVKTSTVIVVVDTPARTIGLVADAVLDILTISEDQIQEVPDVLHRNENAYINGVAVIDGKMVTMLDIGQLVSSLH
ncbi:chemotaxis protein CheW [Rhizomicrobium electricum]|uniref:Chemotaxis protein CheW n=1 Tax=Rhizomicrobium electricum TaxID=480070 RepID=A0ABN1E8H4_9PROT|nr:chemotaxis protein CheW [Rhizomicrobium electricum]NIJ47924.1 purine-binding chemotaxis protein CheW [Rhizomicrobium electricum]